MSKPDTGRNRRLRAVLRPVLAVLFVAAGILHFTSTDFYLGIMPPYVPFHRAAVFGSGVLEIIGGLALLLPRLRRWAAAGLVLLLAAVFPANLHMALHPEQFPDVAPLLLWLRLPLQPLLMALLWWAAGSKRRPSGPSAG